MSLDALPTFEHPDGWTWRDDMPEPSQFGDSLRHAVRLVPSFEETL